MVFVVSVSHSPWFLLVVLVLTFLEAPQKPQKMVLPGLARPQVWIQHHQSWDDGAAC